MTIGHLESCQCSECETSRAQAHVTPRGAPLTAEELAGGMASTVIVADPERATRISELDAQIQEILDSPAYVISVGGVPVVCVLGGDSEFVLEHIAGNLVFSIADDSEVPDRLAVQVSAVKLQGADQIVLALDNTSINTSAVLERLRIVLRDRSRSRKAVSK